MRFELEEQKITLGFDTGSGTYPSISGTHNGTIKPNHTIIATKLYTYPCEGTGWYTEYAAHKRDINSGGALERLPERLANKIGVNFTGYPLFAVTQCILRNRYIYFSGYAPLLIWMNINREIEMCSIT